MSTKASPMAGGEGETGVAPAFDYSAPAELFMLSVRGVRGSATNYRRFETAAEAIRFAMEEMPGELLIGLAMEVDEGRFDHRSLRGLYDHPDYPLRRV